MLEVGKPAPAFGLPDADQEMVHLKEFRDDAKVVLYFYPKDDTPGCTIEAQDFTALAADFADAATTVLGISKDSCASHADFQSKYGLNVRLLSDAGSDVCERYGVITDRGFMRSTFVIDRDGVLRHALYDVNPKGHAELMLQLVRELP